MNDLLLRIRRETGASVLFVTHSISEAMYLSDKVIVFSRRPARVATRNPDRLCPIRAVSKSASRPPSPKSERIASEALGVVPPAEAGAA